MHRPNYFGWPAFTWGHPRQSGSAMAGHANNKPATVDQFVFRDTLSPQPVPENLCELRKIVLEISHAADQSPYISIQVKETLRECTRYLEAECSKFVDLTQLAHRAAGDSTDVLLWRIRFFEALDDRIKELLQLRSRFDESRKAFRARPTNLLLEGIREARGRSYDGMLSDLKPLFEKIERYYNEINVSLYAEEECLKKISTSLCVTPDDQLRWENILDACREASTLLTSYPPPSPPYMPQPTSNKAARHIRALAQTVTDARQSLLQTHRSIAGLTQQPQFSLLRLQSEYETSEQTCRQRIREVHQWSEHFLRSFVKVPPLDDFRDHLLPSAAASSSQVLREVRKQIQTTQYAVLSALPQLGGHFSRFERYLPIADASMQHMYSTLRGLVQPLEQPHDPRQGVFRTMKRKELREEHHKWSALEQKWAAAQL